MLNYKTKRIFYTIAGPFMYLNGKFYKTFKSPRAHNMHTVKVQLGPGQRNYLKGFINVDANIFSGKADVWSDLNMQLPFKDNSIDLIYSHHVVEHLFDLQRHFDDMYRCLKPGGRIRVGGPNGDNAIKKFVENDKAWFSSFPDDRKSIGGRFENFIFCRKEHLTVLTFSFLEEIAGMSGFRNIIKVIPRFETKHPDLIGTDILEMENDEGEYPYTLIVEAEK